MFQYFYNQQRDNAFYHHMFINELREEVPTLQEMIVAISMFYKGEPDACKFTQGMDDLFLLQHT